MAQITRTTSINGRLCNQIIRNLAVSFIAQKNDLKVEYSSFDRIERIGIPLFVGSKVYDTTVELTDDNFMEIVRNPVLANFDPNRHWFQTRQNIRMIYDFFRQPAVQRNIVKKNPYRSRYDNNQDCFMHIRLGDCAHVNPGLEYYKMVLGMLSTKIGRIFIGSDSPDHKIVRELCELYGATIYEGDEVDTLQFASTCKYLILSHGSYSAMMGLLAFDAVVYYSEFWLIWHGDMFSVGKDEGWIEVARDSYKNHV